MYKITHRTFERYESHRTTLNLKFCGKRRRRKKKKGNRKFERSMYVCTKLPTQVERVAAVFSIELENTVQFLITLTNEPISNSCVERFVDPRCGRNIEFVRMIPKVAMKRIEASTNFEVR